jgi:hypothetical protein
MVSEEMNCIYLRQSKIDTTRCMGPDPAWRLQMVEMYRCAVAFCQFVEGLVHHRDLG